MAMHTLVGVENKRPHIQESRRETIIHIEKDIGKTVKIMLTSSYHNRIRWYVNI
jgi:hypothetical protein